MTDRLTMATSAGVILYMTASLSMAAEIPGVNILNNREATVRSIDGSNNNIYNPGWGKTGTQLRRMLTPDYRDGREQPSGENRPSAREISNAVSAATESRPNAAGASDFVWQWGQFLDHDISLTESATPEEAFNIRVPRGDNFFDPLATGTASIPLNRSEHINVSGVRQQINQISTFIDASNVYGSDVVRARALRTLDGSGKLKTSAGNFPPFNTAGLPNAPSHSPSFYLAGDVRANEQIGLLAIHTLFVREHNFLAEKISHQHPHLSGDEIYEFARAIVAAEMQAITYNEFLPMLLGPNSLRPYRGYDASLDPSVANAFSTAAYRFGHTMLSNTLQRLQADGRPIPAGNISLADSFFSPQTLLATGIEPVLRGLAVQTAQEIDAQIVDGVRNFLFGPPGAGGFDLASLNIQRGRDHGLPSFNEARQQVGLTRVTQFHHITRDFEMAAKLENLYGDINDMDLWVTGLAEQAHPRGMLGRTFHKIVADQFTRLRDGDRFWYESSLPRQWVQWVNAQKLSSIIKRNTEIGEELPDNVFIAQSLLNGDRNRPHPNRRR